MLTRRILLALSGAKWRSGALIAALAGALAAMGLGSRPRPQPESYAPLAVKARAQTPDQPAIVPQYEIGSALMFTGDALRSASIALAEQPLRIQYLPPLQQQTRVMLQAIAASLACMQSVQANAAKHNPAAFPATGWAIAELTAARAQAQTFSQALDEGDMGPLYIVTLTATAAHLKAADRWLGRAAADYGASYLADAPAEVNHERPAAGPDSPTRHAARSGLQKR